MGKGTKIAIGVVVFILLVVGVYYLSKNKAKERKELEYYKPLKYQKQSKKGLYIINRLLDNFENIVTIKEIKDPIDSVFETHPDYPSVYVLIDNQIKLSPTAQDSLFRFVEKGNAAFVSVENFKKQFASEFAYDSDFKYSFYTDSLKIDFSHFDLKLDSTFKISLYNNRGLNYRSWNYFNIDQFYKTRDRILIISELEYAEYLHPIFVKIPHGKGYFYLHSIPELFYNETMFTEQGFSYAERVFSSLPKGHYLWHNHTNKYKPWEDFNPNSDASIKRESPIQYILKDKNFRWSYLLLLATLLLYILFQSKRKQRIIPVKQENKNSSLAFVDTVGKLYLNQEKHYKFIAHYQQSFLNFIKDKYYLSSHKIDDEFVKLIALKSDISEEKIKEIFIELDNAKKSYNFTSDQLIKLHKKVEYFYKNCK